MTRSRYTNVIISAGSIDLEAFDLVNILPCPTPWGCRTLNLAKRILRRHICYHMTFPTFCKNVFLERQAHYDLLAISGRSALERRLPQKLTKYYGPILLSVEPKRHNLTYS